ncbi:MAG: Uma2 family endonuclease [Acidobacteria bacterium]|nr:Uma2 family endonuclease [Acidobacteriota bacterium]
MSTKIVLTYEDYLALPNDGKRYEIMRGDLYVSPSPVPRHQIILSRVFDALREYARAHSWGVILPAPLDVLLSQTNIVEPDIIGIAAARKGIIAEKNIEGTPDFLVEIISESTRRNDKVLKLKLYAEFGVKEYWIVDPVIDTVEIFSPAEVGLTRIAEVTAGTADSRLLAGFSIDVAQLFSRDL